MDKWNEKYIYIFFLYLDTLQWLFFKIIFYLKIYQNNIFFKKLILIY
jgi:hypothetical protein